MAYNQLPIRFTEENYATKSEVIKELNMPLIDSIWSNILKYRSNYYRYLSLKSIDKNQLMICYCQTVSNNINLMDGKLLKQMGEYVKIAKSGGDLTHFDELCLISSLKGVANSHNIDISTIQLRSLIQGDLKDLSLDRKILKRYLGALAFVKKKYNHEINIDYLADLYSVFTENPELTRFYRESEDDNISNRVLIDRVYTAAPVNLIDGLMNTYFSFISTSSLSSAIKGIITYYFFNYIKPFPKDNEEIALLMMKSVLANGALSEFGAVLPLENLLNLSRETYSKICTEVQRTNDLTYFVNYILKALDASLDNFADIKANFSTDVVRQDFYKEDEPVMQEVEPLIPYEPIVKEVVKEAPKVVKPEPVIKKEEPAPKKEEPKVIEKETPVIVQELAIAYIPKALDEKEAARLEEHLLEMDPALKKGEAYFYARHCTMHMNYTIAQYQKALGCAYETARTSMEHLVELHYYQKSKVNNKKFVYTPIKRRKEDE